MNVCVSQEEEMSMLGEITHLQTLTDDLKMLTMDPHKLPASSEQVLVVLWGVVWPHNQTICPVINVSVSVLFKVFQKGFWFKHVQHPFTHSTCWSVVTSTRSKHSFLWPDCTQTPSQKHHRRFTAFFSLQVIVDLKGSECTWSYQTPPSSPSTTVSRKSSMCRLVMWHVSCLLSEQ